MYIYPLLTYDTFVKLPLYCYADARGIGLSDNACGVARYSRNLFRLYYQESVEPSHSQNKAYVLNRYICRRRDISILVHHYKRNQR